MSRKVVPSPGLAWGQTGLTSDGVTGETPLPPTLEAAPSDSPNRNLLARALHHSRRMVVDALQSLRPAAGPSTDLERALCSLRAELMFNPTIQYRVFVTGHRTSCCQELQQQIYFIAQEAVTNAVRHSEATTIEVEVQYLYRHLRVIVRDNGLGMDPQTLRSKRDSQGGLLGMLERATNIDGQLKIWSTKGAGTEIEISVSVARN
jgi:signal transduction histidine kinase